jgi:hypothetical protein
MGRAIYEQGVLATLRPLEILVFGKGFDGEHGVVGVSPDYDGESVLVRGES